MGAQPIEINAVEGEGKITCPLCHNGYRSLVGHVKVHGISIKKFREQFPVVLLVSKLSKERISINKRGIKLGPKNGKPWQERFWEKVDIKGPDECWLWKAGKTKDGYGYFRMPGDYKRMHYAHRIAYELLVGPIPDGLEPDHLCSTPPCCNSNHLEPVTHKVNILRGNSPSAKAARQTHCVKGHEFDKENTRIQHKKSGKTQRVCRKCNRITGQNIREKDREKFNEKRRIAWRKRKGKDICIDRL